MQVLLPRHLGDAVLALPALRGLADRTPIRLVAAGAAAAAVAGQGPWTVSAELTAGPAVLFGRSLRAAIAAARAGCSPRIGEAGDARRALLTHVVPPPTAPLPDRTDGRRLPALLVAEHQGDAYLRVARAAAEALGLPPVEPGDSRLRVDPQTAPALHADVVLHPWAAGSPTKRWPEVNWLALARALGDRAVVTGGPSGEDAALAARVAGGPALAGANCLPVPAWAALAATRTVVAPDTGVAHVARAAGARVIALFGSTDPRRHAPRGPGALTLLHGGQALPCSPCYAPSCRHEAPMACLRALSVDAVLTALSAP